MYIVGSGWQCLMMVEADPGGFPPLASFPLVALELA